MSAYAHQMERQLSSQSLSSRGGSEHGSQYTVESGFYMTTFAAVIFIGGLITVGVLLITLLVTLAVMLQSCQNRSSGVVELMKSSGDNNYCKLFALHAELNSLEADNLPEICRGLAIRYIKEGQFARDLNLSIQIVEGYFNTLTPSYNGLDVVLMDIDDIFASSSKYSNPLIDRGWPVILLSRKHEGQRNATTELLISAGYRGWSSLIMRLDNEMQMDSREYLSRRRTILQKEGFHITGLISNQMDALIGQSLGKRVFKLPNPLYYSFDHHIESTKFPS
ncbi:hypothetical protein KPL70_010731 [Citrus sinensis]|nr:hypothetical protein KPL70_010731 [Citrus sinensis]